MQRNKSFKFFATIALLATLVVGGASAHADRLRVHDLNSNQTLNLRSTPGLSGHLLAQIPHNATNLRWDCEQRHVRGRQWYEVRFRGTTGWANAAYLEQHARSDRSCENNARVIIQPHPLPPSLPSHPPFVARELVCNGIDYPGINLQVYPRRTSLKLGYHHPRQQLNELNQLRAGRKTIRVLANNHYLITGPGQDLLFIKRRHGSSALYRVNCQSH